MTANIKASVASGNIEIITSKSYAHRLLIAAALTNEESVIEKVYLSNDVTATLNCIKALGREVIIEDMNNESKKIIIRNNDCIMPNELVFDCFESGSTLRFFIPIALTLGKKVTFKGTKKLLSRGLEPYFDICCKQNIKVIQKDEEITFIGTLQSGDFFIPGNISSQFITGLLFACSMLDGDSRISLTTHLESKNYVDITLDVLKKANIDIAFNQNTYYIKGGQKYSLKHSVVEGDYSNAAFFDALNYLGGNVRINGLNDSSYQGDKVYQKHFKDLSQGFCTIDLKDCIDLGPILFCFAGINHGATFINTNRLKIKESNRINDLQKELIKLGIEVIELDNQVTVKKKVEKTINPVLDGSNDHRIVMALSVLLTTCGGRISGIEAVKKSYPNFFEDLIKLGIEVEYES